MLITSVVPGAVDGPTLPSRFGGVRREENGVSKVHDLRRYDEVQRKKWEEVCVCGVALNALMRPQQTRH